MPSWVECTNKHWWGLCRDAAIEIAKKGTLGQCPKCGSDVHYWLSQTYSNSGATHNYKLIRVFRTSTDLQVIENEYDPMIFLLQHVETGAQTLWPFYWTKDKNKRWHVGQFPPLLEMHDLIKAVEFFGLMPNTKIARENLK